MNDPALLHLHRPDRATLAAEAVAGLTARPARVPPKFFYDRLGSTLFEAITQLEAYYPTRTEAAIFDQHLPAIADAALSCTGPRPVLVDLGAADCAKGARLVGPLGLRRYLAVDISADYVASALVRLQREHPQVDWIGLGLDFAAGLHLPDQLVDGPALVFYPGSSIGNFDPAAALRLLDGMRQAARGGALLVGVDLVKPTAVLERAYDDELGVTAAFNLNLLLHLNRLLGSDFDPRGWRHVAFYDAQASRIEMHLEARAACWVRWPGGERRFEAGERIHTEDSYKWTPAAFTALLHQAGFAQVRHWTDAQNWFGLFLATG